MAFVHLSRDDEKAKKFFAPHGLEDLPRIGDPEDPLYKAFGLAKVQWRRHFSRASILRVLIALLQGHWPGMPDGDVERMPGTFLLVNGEIQKAYRNKLVSDRPDYLEMARLD